MTEKQIQPETKMISREEFLRFANRWAALPLGYWDRSYLAGAKRFDPKAGELMEQVIKSCEALTVHFRQRLA